MVSEQSQHLYEHLQKRYEGVLTWPADSPFSDLHAWWTQLQRDPWVVPDVPGFREWSWAKHGKNQPKNRVIMSLLMDGHDWTWPFQKKQK